ncbi:MAG: septum formation inhibitor Maf [Bryobacterales bacterium]|nr:septum formation inhibitor Maf [Bryobacterales bacterium]
MIILASQSPRRQQLLQNAGYAFSVRTSGVVEEQQPGESPRDYVSRLAREKAFAVPMQPGELILAADTEVVLDGTVFGKPADFAHAGEMLKLLSGREHLVLSGICLRTTERTVVDVAETKVVFRRLGSDEILEYVRSGEPMDKAGGYAIQGRASRFVERIEGCFFNVVGLPVELVDRHLRALGIQPGDGALARGQDRD